MKTGFNPKQNPVHALSIVPTEELRDLWMQYNTCQSLIRNVESREWFDLAYSCNEIAREIERRNELLHPTVPVAPRGRIDTKRDYTLLKRADLAPVPLAKIAFTCSEIARRLDRTIERHGNDPQIARWSFADEREVWQKAAHHLGGLDPALEATQLTALRSLVSSLRDTLENDELRLPKHASYRVILNTRISLLIEIAKRLEA